MRILGVAVALFVLALDQLSKFYVLEHIFRPALGLGDPMRLEAWLLHAPERLPEISLYLLPVFNLSMVWNFGISFGLMSGAGWLLLGGTALITLIFAAWMFKSKSKVEVVALAAIIGGALGNIADRLRFDAVADFLDFHWHEIHFPSFNVADAAISLGVALLILYSLFLSPKD